LDLRVPKFNSVIPEPLPTNGERFITTTVTSACLKASSYSANVTVDRASYTEWCRKKSGPLCSLWTYNFHKLLLNNGLILVECRYQRRDLETTKN